MSFHCHHTAKFVSKCRFFLGEVSNDFMIDRVLVGTCICDALTQWPPTLKTFKQEVYKEHTM